MNTENNIHHSNKFIHKWGGCVFLVILFIVVFIVTLFLFSVFSEYKKTVNTPMFLEKNIDRNLVETSDDPFWGNPDAEIVIVEFGDFECPFCRKAFPVLRELSVEYPDNLKFIYRDFVANAGHLNAQKAAEAAECTNEQNKFLAYHDKLFINQDSLDINSLKKYARQVGLDNAKEFDKCLDDGVFEQEVQQDTQLALDLGLLGTPTFFINGVKISGAVPKELFKKIIDQLLMEKTL